MAIPKNLLLANLDYIQIFQYNILNQVELLEVYSPTPKLGIKKTGMIMQKIEPYKTERQVCGNGIMLDANEHYEQWFKIPNSALAGLNRYPDSSAMALREKLATHYCKNNIRKENILITSGSIEAIDTLVIAYKPSTLILNTPSYDVYKLRADAHGCPSEFIPLDSSSNPQVERIIERAKEGSMVVFISPNNPTGKLMDPNLVRQVIEKSRGMVVIDEAYIEFAGLQNSMQNFIIEYPNVIILRTFSKAWGLAGIRLGYIISAETNIRHLAAYRNAYSVNAVALNVGLHALDEQDELAVQVQRTLNYKKQLVNQFELAGIPVQTTDANFIVLDINDDVAIVHQALRQKSILVRPRPLLGNKRQGLRVTIGSLDENKAVFDAVVEATA